MALTVVIENTVLHGVADDDVCQRVATAYIDGERYTVVAPAKLTGECLQHMGHFSVHEPSKDALDWGSEFLVTDQRKGVIQRSSRGTSQAETRRQPTRRKNPGWNLL